MKRIVIVNGIAFSTTTEEHITARLLKELWGAQEDDQVVVLPLSSEPYQIADETVLLHDVNRVRIVPAFGGKITEIEAKITSQEANAWFDALLEED